MKILVLTPLYHIQGRPELFHDTSAIHYLVKYWAKWGHEVEVIVTYVNHRRNIKRYCDRKQREYRKNGYKYNVDGINVLLIEEQLLFSKQWFTFDNYIHISRFIKKYLKIKKFSPDVIVNHFPSYSYGYIDKLNFDVPKIAVLHQTDLNKSKIDKNFSKNLNKIYDCIYCRSTKILKEAQQCGLNNLCSEIIYSGVPTFENQIKKDFNWKNKVSMLYVGKLIKRKNINLLIKALEYFPNIELSIIGEGEEENNLKNLVSDLRLQQRVKFLGKKTREEVSTYMKKADIFSMISINETFGLVYLEALQSGCITIGTINEGIDGVIIDGENGFLCEPKLQSFVSKLEQILSLPDKKVKKIMNNAKETSEIFSEENASRKYLNLIETVKYKK